MLTFLIIALTGLVSYMALQQPSLVDRYALRPQRVLQQGEWYRLITCGFLHADFNHLLFNMLTLYFFGNSLEGVFAATIRVIPHQLAYLLFYSSALIVSSLPSVFRFGKVAGYRSIGASGAVAAVLFAHVMVRPTEKIYLFFVLGLPGWAVALLYLGYSVYASRRQQGSGINYDAHLWGSLFGIAFMLLALPQVGGHFIERILENGLF